MGWNRSYTAPSSGEPPISLDCLLRGRSNSSAGLLPRSVPRYVLLCAEVVKHTPPVLVEELGLVEALLAQVKTKCSDIDAAIGE